jgi:hypothetical protein
VQAARHAVVDGGAWSTVGVFVAVVAASSAFATWTFRVYQRSL